MRSSLAGSRAWRSPPSVVSRRAAVFACAAALAALPVSQFVYGAEPGQAADCSIAATRGRAILAELYVAEGCPDCADAVRRLESIARLQPGLIAVLIPDLPLETGEEAVYARRQRAIREHRRARLGLPVAPKRPHLLLQGSEVPAGGTGEQALERLLAAESVANTGRASGLKLETMSGSIETTVPRTLRVRVEASGDAGSRGARMEFFVGLARTRTLAGGGVIHELGAWQGPLRPGPGARLELVLRVAPVGSGQSVLAFAQDPATRAVSDAVVVPVCPLRPGSGGPRSIRP